MAIYEYLCRDCGERVELMRQTSEMDKTVYCERCGCQCDLIPSVPSTFQWGPGPRWNA